MSPLALLTALVVTVAVAPLPETVAILLLRLSPLASVRIQENALKRFKRSCAKSGVLAEVRKREYYDSPSVKRRKKSEAARKNRNKKFY